MAEMELALVIRSAELLCTCIIMFLKNTLPLTIFAGYVLALVGPF